MKNVEEIDFIDMFSERVHTININRFSDTDQTGSPRLTEYKLIGTGKWRPITGSSTIQIPDKDNTLLSEGYHL